MTPDEKIACIDKQMEMLAACSDYHCIKWCGNYSLTFKLKNIDGDLCEVRVSGNDLPTLITEAYSRYRRFIGALPEFDANRTIEHKPEPVR